MIDDTFKLFEQLAKKGRGLNVGQPLNRPNGMKRWLAYIVRDGQVIKSDGNTARAAAEGLLKLLEPSNTYRVVDEKEDDGE